VDTTDPASILPAAVTIVEVGARDGLQNEDAVLPTDVKVDLIHRLAAAGARRIETASFVHPGLVPQMADAAPVMEALGPSPQGVSYIGLVLNRRGLDRALATVVDEINFSVSASEGFSHANQGAPVEEVMGWIEEMIPEARAEGRATTVTISVVWGCPFEGEVSVEQVLPLVQRATAAGADEIALGDTIGVAVPFRVAALIEAVSSAAGAVPLRVHFHDTRNTAVANVYAAMQSGVSTVDAAVGGAGGCPFAPNATGNVATEDVLYLMERSDIVTGIDMEAVADVGHWLAGQLGKALPSAIGRAGGFP